MCYNQGVITTNNRKGDDTVSIGANIYDLRKAKKMTQSQLAEKLGVSDQAVSKWENELCAPDVSLFPVIAEFFGVSIDRLFGYHAHSYEDEVKAIIKAADDSMDTDREIEILSEGLKRYPNSPELKVYLAFSLSMVNRRSKDERERREAVAQAVGLCNEVVDFCGDSRQVDSALNMLARIYNETQEYEKAAACIEKISADGFSSRITGMVHLLEYKGSFVEQRQYAAYALWEMYWTMSHVLESVGRSFVKTEEYDRAWAFCEAQERLLSMFDAGCPDFYATYKIFACEQKAKIYMKMGDRERCLEELRRFFVLAEQVKKVAKCEDFCVSERNPLYFSDIKDKDKAAEEWMPEIYPERALPKYDAFFGEDPAYLQFKKEVSV